MKTSMIAAVLALASLAVGGAMWGVSQPDPEPRQEERSLLPVQVVTVRSSDRYAVREQYAGRVVSRRTSQLGFERSGLLTRVLRDDGDAVEAGELLAELDTRALRAQRRELRARIQEIGARLELARVTTKRRQNLHDAGHLSPQELDEAVFSERALEAERAAARASLENVSVSLALSRIEAPYAGSISMRMVDEGTVVSPGQPILELIETGSLEVRVGLPPQVAASLSEGSRHPIQVEGRPHEAVLAAVLSTVEPDTRTVTAVFRVEEPSRVLRDGALARISLEREIPARGQWLPITALAESHRGLWSAYAVVADAQDELRLERRQLEVLHPEAERAYVRGTLKDGERVVADGVHRLVPGMAVRLAERPAGERL